MPGMKILEGVDEEFWWEVARGCDYATFFHTPLWHQLAEKGLGGCRDVTFSAVTEGGTRVVFPLLEKTAYLGAFRQVFSTFAGCYGGPISDGPVGPEKRGVLYQAAARGRALSALNGNPLVDDDLNPDGFQVVHDSTHLLPLDAPFDELFKRFSKGHRSSTLKGKREGIIPRKAESLEDYRRYFRVYEDSLKRWGDRASSRYPWDLFQEGYNLASLYPDNMVLWLAEGAGEVAAGAWVFYWNRHAVYWHGASSEVGQATSAANVVLAQAIEDAQRRGFSWFDFNPSGGHAGTAAFKRRFGSHRVPFRRHSRTGLPLRALQGTLRFFRRGIGGRS